MGAFDLGCYLLNLLALEYILSLFSFLQKIIHIIYKNIKGDFLIKIMKEHLIIKLMKRKKDKIEKCCKTEIMDKIQEKEYLTFYIGLIMVISIFISNILTILKIFKFITISWLLILTPVLLPLIGIALIMFIAIIIVNLKFH